MTTQEFRVSYSMHMVAESAQEAAEMLADLLTNSPLPQRGLYEVEDEAGDVTNVDLGEQRGEW